MTIEHWLTIVLITSSFIAQLIAPALADFVRSRINQPKPIPQPNQPKNRTQRIVGAMARFFESLWWIVGWPLVFIPYYIYALVREVRRTTPLTRDSVVLISVIVAAGFFLLLNMSVGLVQRQARLNAELIGTQANNMLGIVNLVEAVQRGLKIQDDRIDLLIKASEPKAEPDKPTLGILRRMLTAINNVLKKSN